ncbi:hypothetical protein BP5796_02932 [Coleophoma crateriformis]|uniref:DUF3445 domain-containing protein n=1 Tax=Coleophoma crateriformis TaxID=565419 RepID=A0A3D8SN69_9HELO|nr:hypothetical protein BP5796_02932 [Coleophoma crateriformis]
MDWNYLERINLRKKLMVDEAYSVLAAQESVKAAVDEFYVWMMGVYLPTRFPRAFQLTHDGHNLRNLVTGDVSPVTSLAKPLDALRTLGATIEDELLFLLPSPDGDGYTLQGYVNCFPGGFEPREKFNMKLRDIHIPVPSYKEKMEKSMDRFFERIEVGTFVKRANWSINTTDQLFVKKGNHLYGGEQEDPQEINPATTFMRCERQVVHRLPKTKALLLTVKTFLYPVEELKAEGAGEEMIAAIDGLKAGNAPGIHFYKRAGIWGDSLKAYLRS